MRASTARQTHLWMTPNPCQPLANPTAQPSSWPRHPAPILARVHRPLAPHPRRCILRPCCPSTPRLPPPTPSYPRLPPPTPRPPPAASAQDWRGAGVWPDGEARGRHRGLGCASRDLGCGVWGVVRGVWGVGCGRGCMLRGTQNPRGVGVDGSGRLEPFAVASPGGTKGGYCVAPTCVVADRPSLRRMRPGEM